MGVVYKAWDEALERWVALKMIHPTLAEDEKFLKRFRAEARALAKLENPNIVTVFDLQETESGLCIVMQYVEGANLTATLQNGPLPIASALPIIKQVLTALGHAHQAGVIHRDIKPSNIMLTAQGLVKITDFGMAKIHAGLSLTQSTSTGGTLYYMPPEQLKSLAHVDQRCDIYSTGMTFYEMLAGRLPLEKQENLYALSKAIVESKFSSPDHFNAAIPNELSAIVMKAIAKEPEKRYQSAEEMLAAIAECEARRRPAIHVSQPTPSRGLKQRRLLIAAYSLLVLILISSFVFLSPDLRRRALNFFSKPTFSALSVSSVPAGASVFLNGDSLGVTPIIARSVKAGTFSLRLKKQDYLNFDTTVVIAAGRNAAFSFSLAPMALDVIKLKPQEISLQPPAALLPAVGALRIISQPADAAIYLNAQPRGTTPRLIKDLAPGSYTIVLKKTGYKDYPGHVTVEAGKETTFDAELPPLTGMLRVGARPAGAIYIDGERRRELAAGPYETSLPIGRHSIKVTHPDFGVWEKSIDIKSEVPQVIEVDFNQFVHLTVAVTSGWGEIYVDGKALGEQTPKRIQLRVGKHVIEVRREGYVLESGAKEINLEADVEEPLVFTLKKTP